MVTTIYTTTNTATMLRLGDNATAGQGTYEIYANPLDVKGNVLWPSLTSQEIATVNIDWTLSMKNGWSFDIKLTHEGAVTKWDNFKKALVYWAENNTKVYMTYTIPFSTPDNILEWPNWSTQTLEVMSVRPTALTIKKIQGTDHLLLGLIVNYKNI